MTRVPVAGVALAIIVSCPPSAAAERPWSEARSPHFLVKSDGDEKSARAIVWRFEQLRVAIRSLWKSAPEAISKPVVVLAARDEAGLRSLAPQLWEERGGVRPASVFVNAPNGYYIAVRSDLKVDSHGSVNPYFSADWSYAMTVITAGLKREWPQWFMRGFASLLSNVIVRETHLDVGRAVPWHLQRLRNGSRLSLNELFAVDRNSPTFKDAHISMMLPSSNASQKCLA